MTLKCQTKDEIIAGPRCEEAGHSCLTYAQRLFLCLVNLIIFLHKWLPENGSLNHCLVGETQSHCLFLVGDLTKTLGFWTKQKNAYLWNSSDICYLVTGNKQNACHHYVLKTLTILLIDHEISNNMKKAELGWLGDWLGERAEWGSHQAHSHYFIDLLFPTTQPLRTSDNTI